MSIPLHDPAWLERMYNNRALVPDYMGEPLKTAVFSPSLTQAVRNPQICLFFVQFRLFLGFFVPHSSRIGPLQAHLGL